MTEPDGVVRGICDFSKHGVVGVVSKGRADPQLDPLAFGFILAEAAREAANHGAIVGEYLGAVPFAVDGSMMHQWAMVKRS